MVLPTTLVPLATFYDQKPERKDSHVLNYGSGWRVADWTDGDHVVDVLWFGETHELVAFYMTYDWSKLAPGKLSRDALVAEGLDIAIDDGMGIGRVFGDMDLARTDVHVEILGTVKSDLACHELMWGWQWWHHHPDGLDHVRQRIDKAGS
jgi:hypothetical protein